ncbi:MAG: MBL fold metallo-hydrolase [Opitutaceae bacterium]|nr:MBL fold metallo-hydrolase [Opitutaceae bacterium]
MRLLSAGLAGAVAGRARGQPSPPMPAFPLSDHYDGQTFRNPRNHVDRSWTDVMRWKWKASPTPWPTRVPVTPIDPARGPLAVTAVGHASLVVDLGGQVLLTDPVWSDRVSPVSWAGPRRVQAPGVPFASLPRIAAVLLSHDHYDHCDLPTLRKLAAGGVPRVITPLANGDLLREAGFARDAIVELDWWQEATLPGGAITVCLTPAQHWSNRAKGRRNGRLWGGFFVRSSQRTFFFAGDTATNDDLFAGIRQRLGPPDLAALPIGAYEPQWFMQGQHCNPAEAVAIHRFLEAKASIGVHWGTFQLTDEGRDAPVVALAEALAAQQLPPSAFVALPAGSSLQA